MKLSKEASKAKSSLSCLNPFDQLGGEVARFGYINSRKLGITPELISGLLRRNPYSLNLQRCETGNLIGLFARSFGLLIKTKYLND